ncbi:MFS transporter [Alteromonas sp. RKMC-009]|uniref:MFS transporter n=1 Tax=Alteromonas sp. RKMC-009 TaxID=2267264 RepID=UPI00137560A5|nr:glycoside-pentoside-hexuronide (GPH):cation symporter [Alteromonas sp. RKMC-009]
MSASQNLKLGEKVSFGAGEVASNLTWNLATGFLLLYYTDVALLPAASLGILMLVTRVLDAVFDPIAGIAVDRTNSLRGKARPYLLYAPIPFAILYVATFSVPDWSTTAKLIYAYITFTLLGLVYSFLYVPYSSMLPMLTKKASEKNQLGSVRAMGSSIASIIAFGLTMPLINYIGGDDRQLGFTVTTGIMVLIAVFLYWICFAYTKERHTQPVSKTRPVVESLKTLIRNPVWRAAFFIKLLVFIRIGIMVSCLAYFAKQVMGDISLISVILPLMSIAIFVGGALSSTYISKIGLERGNIIALSIQSALFLSLFFFEDNRSAFIAIFVIANIFSGIAAASGFRVSADAVEWHEKYFGHRDEGLIASVLSFGLKVGLAIGSALTGFVLGWADYDPAVVTELSANALRSLLYLGPVLANSFLILCWVSLINNRKKETNGQLVNFSHRGTNL